MIIIMILIMIIIIIIMPYVVSEQPLKHMPNDLI